MSVGLGAGFNGQLALQPSFDSLRHDRDITIAVVVLEHLKGVLNEHVLRAVAVENYPPGFRNLTQIFFQLLDRNRARPGQDLARDLPHNYGFEKSTVRRAGLGRRAADGKRKTFLDHMPSTDKARTRDL